MKKVRLTKLSNNKNNLRTPSLEGVLASPVEVGYSVVIIGNPLNGSKEDVRQVVTSVVKEISPKNENSFDLKTLNSKYLLEYLEDK